jgi:hypothetical protein
MREIADRCLRRTEAILDKFRYRIAGTDECRGAEEN